jgi:hypothetical protein
MDSGGSRRFDILAKEGDETTFYKAKKSNSTQRARQEAKWFVERRACCIFAADCIGKGMRRAFAVHPVFGVGGGQKTENAKIHSTILSKRLFARTLFDLRWITEADNGDVADNIWLRLAKGGATGIFDTNKVFIGLCKAMIEEMDCKIFSTKRTLTNSVTSVLY